MEANTNTLMTAVALMLVIEGLLPFLLPTNRICPSDIPVSRRKASRHTVGNRNGRKPSMTSISATAIIRVFV